AAAGVLRQEGRMEELEGRADMASRLAALGSCVSRSHCSQQNRSWLWFATRKSARPAHARTTRRGRREMRWPCGFRRLTGPSTFATMPAAVGEAERPPTVVVWNDT